MQAPPVLVHLARADFVAWIHYHCTLPTKRVLGGQIVPVCAL